MNYKSTRSHSTIVASQAILDGIAQDGGLYVPTEIPKLDFNSLMHMSYQEIAFAVLSLFFDEFEDLNEAISKAYSLENFHHPKVTGIRKLDNQMDLLELFYGKTSAFKDYALSLYPYLLKLAMKKHNTSHLTILTATSGDTGKAAMEAIQDIEGLSIAVLYPKDGTSFIQKLQMQTQKGSNVFPIGIHGNFDDAQTLVKEFFINHNDLNITSANSINIARLLPQIVYYFDAFVRIKPKEAMDVYVPTGNFGNILAAYIAKEMGLPIRKLIVCTNENNILYEFFQTGVYDITNKDFKVTYAPSMDILISSNLERLLYFVFKDTDKVTKWMEDLKERKYFKLNQSELSTLQDIFDTQMSTDAHTFEVIKNTFTTKDILIDPHTATAIPQNQSNSKKLIVSTASPYKFPALFKRLFSLEYETDDFYILSEMSLRSHEPYPVDIRLLPQETLKHTKESPIENVETLLLEFIQKGEQHEV